MRYRLALFVALFAATLWVVAQTQDPIQQKLDQVQEMDNLGGREETRKVVAMLKSLQGKKMTEEQHDVWLQLSRDYAIRAVDTAWLKELQKFDSQFSMNQVYSVLYGYGKLTAGDVAGAEAILKDLDLAPMTPRDGRRVLGLRARIARLQKDLPRETMLLEKMIDHLPAWPTPTCTPCHDQGDIKVTRLPVEKLWFGERYVEILAATQQAKKVRDESLAALKANPKDDLARIRLGYAQTALKDTAGAKKTFAALKYTSAKLPEPRMFFAFP